MITHLELKNFRKFDDYKLSFNKNLIILLGNNAVGKTSILESIFIMSSSKSHRTNDLKEVIKYNKEFSKILINTDKKYELIMSNKGKIALINGVEYKKISDFIGNIKTVIFSPTDLNLVLGNKSDRRNFLDLEISMLSKTYIYDMKLFKKLLKERNELLKIYDENKKTILNIITDQLIEINLKLINQREIFLMELNNYLKNIHKEMVNEEIEIKYLPSVNKENINEIFKNKLNYDIFTKSTNYGCHRDDFIIKINDKNVGTYGSQGQIRGSVISLKIALFYLFKDKFNKSPILLLDDVFSELDDERQKKLVKFLLDEPQTFISTTNIDLIPKEIISKAQILKLD